MPAQANTPATRKVKHTASVERKEREKRKEMTAAREKHNKTLQLPSVTLLATAAMKAAKEACEAKVDAIVEECLAKNRRFRDSKFDLLNERNRCLYSSMLSPTDYSAIDGVKRVGEIFRNPVFYLDGAHPDDIKQGALGDCWLIASLATLTNIPGLIEQLCVKKNEQVGVYGFIFFKDGDWVSTVVDDQLCYQVHPLNLKKSLFFSSCKDERETWLPLLEKAFAKIHGDYESLEGGSSSEGTEDLTGGVSSGLFTSDILDVNKFWEVEMQRVNKDALMGCGIRYHDPSGERHGLVSGHAYSVLRTGVVDNERLVQLRNPWGQMEWNGDWSDQSEKWTPENMALLNQQEKDDGKFWMSYKDFLRVFDWIEICRVFDASWSVASSWIPYNVVPRSSGKFEFELDQDSESVLVLSQPDGRYYGAIQPEYTYTLSFHIYDSDGNLVKRARSNQAFSTRSVNVEVDLKAGQYTVIPHVAREANDVEEQEEEAEEEAEGESAAQSGEVSVGMSKQNFMFQQRKANMVRSMSNARVAGKTLLGVDDEDYEDEDEEHEAVVEADRWELMVGLRVYSHDPTIHLTGTPGEHPVVAEDEEEAQDPEDVTATLADKVEEEWVTDDEAAEEGQAKKGRKNRRGKKNKKASKVVVAEEDAREE
ncbi:hypothetical protein BGZ94_008970 [Podila epigama]|nr:hypothetical protein BGZ94_008970 [Podila epigama]